MTFDIDPEELHQFPDRLFRRELQVPANLREWIEDRDGELAARLDFDRVQLWKREHTAEDLLAASSPWLNALAVVRATNAEPLNSRRVFAASVERLAELVAREWMRWRDLMWMLISWALRRRPRDERSSLVEMALETQPDATSQEEVRTMSTALGQTLEEWAEQRGIERGIEQGIEQGIARGELAASRRLLCRLLEGRFGPVPDDLRRQIANIEDLAQLERSIRRCPNLRSLEELEL